MKRLTIAMLLLGSLTWAARTSAQTPQLAFSNIQCQQKFDGYRRAYQHAATEADRDQARRDMAQLFSFDKQAGCVVSLLLTARPDEARGSLVLAFASTAQKQAGSTASTSGSTNLVSKNFTSRILSVASEYGALTSSTSGQTTTVSGSLDELFTAIEKPSKGTIIECALKTIPGALCVPSGALGFLGRFSYSASLDLNQPTTITGTATGTAQGGAQQITGTQAGNSFSLSQFTSKFFIWAAKPTQQDFVNAITQSPPGDDTDTAQKALIAIQTGVEESWKAWLTQAVPTLLTASDHDAKAALFAQAQQLITVLVSGGTSEPQLLTAALNYSGSLAETAQFERTIYNKAAWAKPILTFQYDYNTPANQPTNSTFRLILGKSISKNWKVTANAAASIYNSTPSSSIPGSSKLRDVQIGVEADRDAYKLGNYLTAAVSAAYYFQDQTSPAILNVTPNNPIPGVNFTGLPGDATQVFTQKGNIHVGQLKITLGGSSSSGWSLPIAITGSNRSELITKPRIGAQIGISYNFDSLFAGK
jgi:hypothetical protein